MAQIKIIKTVLNGNTMHMTGESYYLPKDLEKYYLEKIEDLENYIEEIDYQWSRFSKTDEELEEERLNLPPLEPRVYGPDVRTLSSANSKKDSKKK